MNDSQSRKATAGDIAFVIIVAIVAAVVVTLAQVFVAGKFNVAIMGGIVGAVTAIAAVRVVSKRATRGS